MDLVGEIKFPRGWDVEFGRDFTSSAIIELAPDYSVALSQPLSMQMWIIDPSSQLELVVFDTSIVAICWIAFDMIAVGMINGEVILITKVDDGFSRGEKKVMVFHESSIKSLHMSNISTEESTMKETDLLFRSSYQTGSLWLLYQDNVLLAVNVQDILDNTSADSQPKFISCTLDPISLKNNSVPTDIIDAAACCSAAPSLLDITASLSFDTGKKITILTCGSSPYPLTFYCLSNSSGKPRGFRQIARHAAHAFKATAVSFLGGFLGTSAPKEDRTVTSLEEVSALKDDRRVINSIVLDPSSKYALCPDNLGRVLLVDVEANMVIRLWKGVRAAQCGWIQEHKKSRPKPLLYMCIYSPKRGFVEVFSAYHGPKVRTITVGFQARLLRTISLSSSTALENGKCTLLSSCAILRANYSSPTSKIEVFKLDHIPPASSPLSSDEPPIPNQAPGALLAATTSEQSSDREKEVIQEDTSLVQTLSILMESLRDGSMDHEIAELEALQLFRRLKTNAGVRDASLLLTSWSSTNTGFKQHITLLRIANEWALDADAGGLLFQVHGDINNTTEPFLLTSFLKQRSVLLDAYESIKMVHLDESVEDIDQFGPSASPEGWINESWRVEASRWAMSQPQSVLSQRNSSTISLCQFLTTLEVKTSKVSMDMLNELSSFMFCPLLQDIFVLSTVVKAMKDVGPCLPLLLKKKSVCVNPVFANMDTSSSSLFVGDSVKVWAPTAIFLFANWLRSLSVTTLNQQVLMKSASSSGVLRFLEGLCAHCVEATESTSVDTSTQLSPCWVNAHNLCATLDSSHAISFAVAVILQETHHRTSKLLESKTYGMKSSPVSALWDQVLCGLRCCLLIKCRQFAIESCFAQLESKGILPSFPTGAMLEAHPLSASLFERKREEKEILMKVIVQDRCALDLLHIYQLIWIELHEEFSKQQGTSKKLAINEEKWPDPRECSPSHSKLWSTIACDQILKSWSNLLDQTGPLKNDVSRVFQAYKSDTLPSLFLPIQWVPLAELFLCDSQGSDKSDCTISRFCFHCHCSVMFAQLIRSENGWLKIQSLQLTVAHIDAISRSQLPTVNKSDINFETPIKDFFDKSNNELVTKTVVELERHEKKWYELFDYDLPSEGYAQSNDKVIEDQHAQALAAALSIRIFEDTIFPEVIGPFLVAQKDSESDTSRISNCFLSLNRSSEEVLQFCSLTCVLLDLIIKSTSSSTTKLEALLAHMSGVFLLVDSEIAGYRGQTMYGSKEWNVSEGKEWLLGRAAALEKEYQTSQEADEDNDTLDDDTDVNLESDMLNEVLKCGGDRQLEKMIVAPTLRSLPNMASIKAHILTLRMVAAIEVVKQSQFIRPPVHMMSGAELNSKHSLCFTIAIPETSCLSSIERFLLRLFVSMLTVFLVDSEEYCRATEKLYQVGQALNQSQLWYEQVDWFNIAKICHVLALLCIGGFDDKALELMCDVTNRELLGEVVLYVCGTRIKLTLDHLLKDRSGRFAPLVASLDAGLCDSNSSRVQNRQSSVALLSESAVKMNAVSHEGTMALLAHILQSAHYHIISKSTGDGTHTLSQEAQDMRTLLSSIVEGLRQLSRTRK